MEKHHCTSHVGNDQEDIVKLLLARPEILINKADNKGWTPLDSAIYWSDANWDGSRRRSVDHMLQILIAKGARRGTRTRTAGDADDRRRTDEVIKMLQAENQT